MTLRLAITPGEPAGIGPDLVVQIAQQAHDVELVLIADPEVIKARAEQLKLPLKLHSFNPNVKPSTQLAGELTILPVTTAETVIAGELNPNNGAYVIETLSQAIKGCQQAWFDGMVTAPVNKAVINDAGTPFSGHTEFLAEQTDTEQVVMMLASDEMRVALVTTHLPLKDVAEAINANHLEKVIRILAHDLEQHFGIAKPRITVLGLNPHAGEGGHMGREEIDVIIPVMEKLKIQGINLTGPLPADTAFTQKHLQACDAVLAMYHDQGLPTLKYQSFGQGVNITLGLPIIRTSVDHGTALDLAGTGKADAGSLNSAINYAISLAKHRRLALDQHHSQLSSQ